MFRFAPHWKLFLASLGLLAAACQGPERRDGPSLTELLGQNDRGPSYRVSVVGFDNDSAQAQGFFDPLRFDPLSEQAFGLLQSALSDEARFQVLEVAPLQSGEACGCHSFSWLGPPGMDLSDLHRADFSFYGRVTEFGRKDTEDGQAIASCRTTLTVFDANTLDLLFAVEGTGEVVLTEEEQASFASGATKDQALNARVLEPAIRDAVARLAARVDEGAQAPMSP